MENSEILEAAQTGIPEVVAQGNPPVYSRKVLLYLIGTVLLSIITSVLSVIIYDQYYATKIIALDFKGFITYQRELYMTQKITDAQFRQNIDNLEKIVLGVPRNHVVIMGDAVLGRVEKIDFKQFTK